jgi:hypothetical protein
VLSKLTYANVVSTIALFGVLAGGYAVAFKGQGSLQRTNIANPVEDGEGRLVKLRGIGQLRVGCSASGITTLFLQNNSGRTLEWSMIRSRDDTEALDWPREEVADGTRGAFGIAGPVANKTQHWLSIAALGKSPRPQVMGVINADRGCETGRTSAMLISTEE